MNRARETLSRGVPAHGHPLWPARALTAIDVRQVPWLPGCSVRTGRGAPGDAEVAEKGLMLATRGQLDEAALHLEDAGRLDRGWATARFNLALVRLQQGRSDAAVAFLRDARRLDPGYVQAGALRELGGGG